MKSLYLLLIAVLSVSLFAETVVKNSAPFAFPMTGIREGHTLQAGTVSFICKTHFAGRSAVTFSWSLPSAAGKGAISILNIKGSQIKSFAITSHQGSVEWDVSKESPIANGIYIATLSYGTIKRDCKVVLYK